MSTKTKKQYLKTSEVEIHELANISPIYTKPQFNALKASIEEFGQRIPIVMYRGRCIDGRHRLKALNELGVDKVHYTNEDSKKSIEDLKKEILGVYENRRHQSPTQKAILAYKAYAEGKANGEKISQGAVADEFGTTRLMLSRAKSLHTLAGDEILEFLFNGNTINTGTSFQPNNTDSLATLITFYKNRNKNLLDASKDTKVSDDLTEDEINMANTALNELSAIYSGRVLKRVNSMLYYKLKDMGLYKNDLKGN